MRRKTLAVALLGTLSVAFPAIGQAKVPPPGVPCTYDALDSNEREIIQYLLSSRSSYESHPFGAIDQPGGIKPYLDRALGICQKTYGWSRAKSRASQYYAVSTLMRELYDALLRADGQDTADIVDLFERDRVPVFTGRISVERALDHLVPHLKKSGWKLDSEKTRTMARNYFILLLTRDQAGQGFARGVFPY